MFPPARAQRAGAVVLVHGAWVGEWSWLPLTPLLAASGRPVHAVSLTGHGVRSHQSSPDITLDDHVEDLVGVVETFDLLDVILVGHSYGGRVITRAYERLASRIARMVYIDAHAPIAPDSRQSPGRLAEATEHGGFIEFAGYDPRPEDVGGPDGLAWFLARVRPQSFKTFSEPITGDLPESLDKAYVFCTGYSPSLFEGYAAAARSAPDWEYHELDTDHWPMISRPRQLTSIILGDRTERSDAG